MELSSERREEILKQLHFMQLQLESYSNICYAITSNTINVRKKFVERNGSIRGRRNLVKNTVRTMTQKMAVESTFIIPEEGKVVVYLTTCGILRKAFEKCRIATNLLEAFRIKFEIRDLNISSEYVDELIERLQIPQKSRNLVFDCLPSIYINGYYFGNEATLEELNDKKLLTKVLENCQRTSSTCSECGGRGYVVCRICHGSRRHHHSTSSIVFGLQLRCSFCDVNGITRCASC
ncbi:unnamed protein product [Caenorhabditis bovis]|uniref:Glutaredoxin domain-containing protein n=1 Tax=Caenorhabditis bovis TaxID=2654633 RepID=A0A8S1EXN1_9PELO|nr:unnamed protein product [Caenorhabditis bovis]